MMRITWDDVIFLFKQPLFILYSGLFSFIFFILFFNFSYPDQEYDMYLEKYRQTTPDMFLLDEEPENISVSSGDNQKEKYDQIINDLRQKIEQKERELSSYEQVNFVYYPTILEKYLESSQWVKAIKETISSDIFSSKSMNFLLEFYKKKEKIRGKFYNNTIQMYGISELNTQEILSVFIHELWHYFDIIYLEKQVLYDVSDLFYTLSWSDINIMKAGGEKKDFVSGYAMTNKYEDFAESFLYYILFNDDFRQKAVESEILQKKYDFFSRKIFRNDEFKKTNFRLTDKIEPYYWDTTKIIFSLENFLDYLKKWV